MHHPGTPKNFPSVETQRSRPPMSYCWHTLEHMYCNISWEGSFSLWRVKYTVCFLSLVERESRLWEILLSKIGEIIMEETRFSKLLCYRECSDVPNWSRLNIFSCSRCDQWRERKQCSGQNSLPERSSLSSRYQCSRPGPRYIRIVCRAPAVNSTTMIKQIRPQSRIITKVKASAQRIQKNWNVLLVYNLQPGHVSRRRERN